MRQLWRVVLLYKRSYALLGLSIVSMLMMSAAAQLEILSVRLLFSNDAALAAGSQNIIEKLCLWLKTTFSLDSNMFHLSLWVVVVSLFRAVSQFTNSYTTQLVSIRVSQQLRSDFFEHLQGMSMSFYHRFHSGNLSSRVIADAGLVATAINSFLLNYLQTPLTLMAAFVALVVTSWKLSLIIFIGCPLIIFPVVFLARKVKGIARQLLRNQETFASVLLDFLGGVQTIKIFGSEHFSLEKYKEHNARMAQLEEKSVRYALSARPISHMIGSFFLATVLLFGLYVEKMTTAELLWYCGILYLFYEPVKKFAEENANIQRGVAAAERMWEVLSMVPEIVDSKDAKHIEHFEDAIDFDGVWFRYDAEWVLKNVSFRVKKGECVAIVGPTGSGKSTIAGLIPRLYEVERGEIRIDGLPITEIKQQDLRALMAFVPQKPFIFCDTVRSNIAFGEEYSQEELFEAARSAHAAEFIENLPGGYDAVLEEVGKNLSGGQQQRLAIARALIKKAPILIMDEATAALDALSEQKIKEAIEELHGSVTQIIIAHRLSTIEHADRIIYLESGTKIAEGTKDELLESCPSFAASWNLMCAGR